MPEPEKKDELTEKKEPASFEDHWKLGMEDDEIDIDFVTEDKYEEPPAKKEAEPSKEDEKKEVEAKAPEPTEAECESCDEKEKGKYPILTKANLHDDKWPKVIKASGQYRLVKSVDDFMDIGSKGFDYIVKTQRLSDDRKGAETEFKDKTDKITSKVDTLYEMLEKQGKIPKVDATEKDKLDAQQREAEVYKEFGIDPEFAEPHEKAIVQRIVRLESSSTEKDGRFQELENKVNLIGLRETAGEMGKSVKKAREEFPIGDVMSEDGKVNHTYEQFKTILTSKVQNEENKNRPMTELASETIKEIHFIQKGTAKASGPLVTDEMSETELEKAAPKLYAKILSKGKDVGVGEHLKEEETTPPSLESRSREIDTSKVKTGKEKSEGLGLEAQLNRALADLDLTVS